MLSNIARAPTTARNWIDKGKNLGMWTEDEGNTAWFLLFFRCPTTGLRVQAYTLERTSDGVTSLPGRMESDRTSTGTRLLSSAGNAIIPIRLSVHPGNPDRENLHPKGRQMRAQGVASCSPDWD